jgi:hypothetical protein
MAGVIKVNGDMGAAGVAQFFGGSKIAFFGMVVKNGSAQAVDMSGEGGVSEAWEAIYKAIAVKGTPVLFQYESGSSGAASWGVETGGAGWTAADLQTAIRALGTAVGANSVDVSGTTVTDVGFKLAAS